MVGREGLRGEHIEGGEAAKGGEARDRDEKELQDTKRTNACVGGRKSLSAGARRG